jgi:5'-3' exonuclease
LVDYYPKDFEVDANGKKNSWECIARIPFINEDTLIDAVCAIDHSAVLQEGERRRNICGDIFRVKPTKPQALDSRKRAGVDLVDKGNWGNALTADDRSFKGSSYSGGARRDNRGGQRSGGGGGGSSRR